MADDATEVAHERGSEVERLLSLSQCRRELQTARLGGLGLGQGMTHELDNSSSSARPPKTATAMSSWLVASRSE